jgi:hypothetical protein
VGDGEYEMGRAGIVRVGKWVTCHQVLVHVILPGRGMMLRSDVPSGPRSKSRRGCSNCQHCCIFSPHLPATPPPSPLSIFTADIMTTYGVSAPPAGRDEEFTSAYNLDDEIGAR